MSDETNEVGEENEEVEETVTDFDVANSVLDSLIESGASEEDMVVALIGEGYKFGKAARLMKDVLEDRGLRVSPKERFAAVEELLASKGFNPETWDDVENMAASLSEEIEATTKSQAISAIRKYAKQNGIELPAKPKGGGGTRVNVFDKFYIFANANPDCTDEEIGTFCGDLGVSEKQAEKYLGRFTGIMKFARELNA